MNDRQLQCFLQAATFLNFHKAAELLYLSQPALTYQIKSMEAELGFDLFDRSKRQVELTPAGKALYEEMIPLWGSLRTAVERARSVAESSSSVTIRWAPVLLSQERFTEFLRFFRDTHPDIPVKVEVAERSSLKTMDDATAVITLQEDAERFSELKTVPLFSACRACLVSTSHPLASIDSISWDMLRSQTLLLVPQDRYPSSYANVVEEAQRYLPLRNIVFMEDTTAIDMNIAAGRGIAIRPIDAELLGKPQNGIVAILLKPLQSFRICVAANANAQNAVCDTLLEAAAEFFGSADVLSSRPN